MDSEKRKKASKEVYWLLFSYTFNAFYKRTKFKIVENKNNTTKRWNVFNFAVVAYLFIYC